MKSTAKSCLVLLAISSFLIPLKGDIPIVSSAFSSIMMKDSTRIQASVKANADTTEVEIKTEGIDLSYSVPEIKAKAGEILRIQYINESDMSHNMVFVKGEEDIRPVGVAALQAIKNDWIPEKEMDRIIAYSALAHAGDTVSFAFEVPPPGIYPYICTYSAHWTQMQGRLISTE